MIVRGIDIGGDWNFGKGRNDYLSNNAAIAQSIATRLRSFLGDCFFDGTAGLDWFRLLGSKDTVALNLAVRATILNTREVTRLNELSIINNAERNLALSYEVNTAIGSRVRSASGVTIE